MALIKCGVVRVISNLIWGQVCEICLKEYTQEPMFRSRLNCLLIHFLDRNITFTLD